MNNYPAILDDVLTASEVAERYGISTQRVRLVCGLEEIPCRKSGATWLISKEDADRKWKDRKRKKAGSEDDSTPAA